MSGQPSIADLLPEVLRDDWTLVRWAGAIDQLLDPLAAEVDRLDRHVDPACASPAMVDWMCFWWGWELPTGWPVIERRRQLLLESGSLRRARGTRLGLQRLAEVLGGADVEAVEIDDTGWVTTANVDNPVPPVRPGVYVTIHAATECAWAAEDRQTLVAILERDVPLDVELSVTWI